MVQHTKDSRHGMESRYYDYQSIPSSEIERHDQEQRACGMSSRSSIFLVIYSSLILYLSLALYFGSRIATAYTDYSTFTNYSQHVNVL
jgi:hypothetical protein